MKILLSGGGTGGHFYPLIAVAEALHDEIAKQDIIGAKIYYIADSPYDEKALFENEIEFIPLPTGKLRLYFSLSNVTDIFKTFVACFKAFSTLTKLYPDVIFSKGGYPAFPVMVAAFILRIPVIIHESDTVPGKVNKFSGLFAKRIALSFKEATEHFKTKKDIIAWTGQPIRKELFKPIKEGVFEYLNLSKSKPIITIYGGSQGAKIINDAVLEVLPELLEKYQVVHQVGIKNYDEIVKETNVILTDNKNKDNYKPFGFLNSLSLKMLGGTSALFVSRAGAGSIFDIALWHVPGIVIPIANSNGNHQASNAFAYAKTGACVVMEEKNLKPHLFLAEINRLFDTPGLLNEMSQKTNSFVHSNAANVIAEEIIRIAITHE